MKTSTFTDFRQNMREYLDTLLEDQDILLLTGPRKKDFVVLTLEAFNALEETAHLFSTTVNIKRLEESMEQDEAGKVAVKKLFPGPAAGEDPGENQNFNGPKTSH